MNIINAILIYLIIISFSTLHTMEIVFSPLQKQYIPPIIYVQTIQDIPKLSLAEIHKYSTKIPLIKEKLLSRSITFNIALLPKEITCTILKLMFNTYKNNIPYIAKIITNEYDDLTDQFYAMPLLFAQKKHVKIQKIVQCLIDSHPNLSSIFNKELIPEFFKLSDKQYYNVMKFLTASSTPSITIPIIVIHPFEENEIKNYPKIIQQVLCFQNKSLTKKIDDIIFLNKRPPHNNRKKETKKSLKATTIGGIGGFGCGTILSIAGSIGLSIHVTPIYIVGSVIATCITTLAGMYIGTGIDLKTENFIIQDSIESDV